MSKDKSQSGQKNQELIEEPSLIEIPEEQAAPQQEPEITEENTSPQEFELAKKHGLVTPKEEKKDEEPVKPKPQSEDHQEKEEEVEHPTFEDIEKKEELLDKYNKNEKALYWKWKTDKHKRQEAQKEKEELEAKYDLDKVKVASYKQKIETIGKLLDEGKDDLTVEQLKKIIEEGNVATEKEPAVSKKSEVEVMREKINVKAQFAEKIGQSKYDNFKEIANLAKEVIAEDKTDTYQSIIDKAFTDDNVDENMLVERVVSIARLSPKFNELTKSGDPEKKKEADKAVANAGKKVSSAAVTPASGKRAVTEDELTVHDAARLTTEQWRKLTPKTKQRLLMGINP